MAREHRSTRSKVCSNCKLKALLLFSVSCWNARGLKYKGGKGIIQALPFSLHALSKPSFLRTPGCCTHSRKDDERRRAAVLRFRVGHTQVTSDSKENTRARSVGGSLLSTHSHSLAFSSDPPRYSCLPRCFLWEL